METLGSKIKQLRKAKGYSLMDLAKMLNVSDTAISKIETGKTKFPSIDIAIKLSEVLGESVYTLFGTSVSVSNNSISFVKLPPNKEKEAKFTLLTNYVQLELSLGTLLLELSSNEKLSDEERYAYRMQKENLQDGLFNMFKIYLDNGTLAKDELEKLINLYPGFNMWQNFLAPLKALVK